MTELLADEALEVGEPALGNGADRAAQVEDHRLGEPVPHEEALLSALDQASAAKGLKVLGHVRDRKAGFPGEGVDGPFALGQQI